MLEQDGGKAAPTVPGVGDDAADAVALLLARRPVGISDEQVPVQRLAHGEHDIGVVGARQRPEPPASAACQGQVPKIFLPLEVALCRERFAEGRGGELGASDTLRRRSRFGEDDSQCALGISDSGRLFLQHDWIGLSSSRVSFLPVGR